MSTALVPTGSPAAPPPPSASGPSGSVPTDEALPELTGEVLEMLEDDRVGTVAVALPGERRLPPLLAGLATPHGAEAVYGFYREIAAIYEEWIASKLSAHTQRAYRSDLQAFVAHLGVVWPAQAPALLTVTVRDVVGWRDAMIAARLAPKTLNRRIGSLSAFYRYLAAKAGELRLPITVPNPATGQFVKLPKPEAAAGHAALSLTQVRQLLAMPRGEDLIAYRDRAILSFYLYTGARLAAGCRLQVHDLELDPHAAEGTTVRLHEKGGATATLGLNIAAAEAIRAYLERAQITAGPVFRARRSSRYSGREQLSDRAIEASSMDAIVTGYLRRLPGAMQQVRLPDGTEVERCKYSTHSLRATFATLALGAGHEMRFVQQSLLHRHITTTQLYDKRTRSTLEAVSHSLPY